MIRNIIQMWHEKEQFINPMTGAQSSKGSLTITIQLHFIKRLKGQTPYEVMGFILTIKKSK